MARSPFSSPCSSTRRENDHDLEPGQFLSWLGDRFAKFLSGFAQSVLVDLLTKITFKNVANKLLS